MALKPISKIAAGVQASTTLAIDSLFKQMKAEGKDVVGFGAGEPDFPTPEHIKQAGIRAIENDQTKYTPTPGTLALRQAVRKRLPVGWGADYTTRSDGPAQGSLLPSEGGLRSGLRADADRCGFGCKALGLYRADDAVQPGR